MCETLPNHVNHNVYFDNWFTSLNLCLGLKEHGLRSKGTVRSNRLYGCPIDSNNELRRNGRGSFSFKTGANSGLLLTKWFDNKCVHLTSTVSSFECNKSVKRWDANIKNHVQVPCPAIVKSYNKYMGGVDLAEMLISVSYPNEIKTVVLESYLPYGRYGRYRKNEWMAALSAICRST